MIYLIQAQTGTYVEDYSEWNICYTTTETAAQGYVELLKKEFEKIPKDQYHKLREGWNKYDPEGYKVEYGGIEYFYCVIVEAKPIDMNSYLCYGVYIKEN